MSLKVKEGIPAQLVNHRIRFALEGDRVFCYDRSKYMPTDGDPYICADGFVFDLAMVAACIRENRFIEEAMVDRIKFKTESYSTTQDPSAQTGEVITEQVSGSEVHDEVTDDHELTSDDEAQSENTDSAETAEK